MKNLAIVGCHPRTRDDVAWNDPNLDIWGFNEVISKQGFFKRADGIFQMHLPAIWKNPANRNDKDHFEWLKANTTIPIFMLEKYPEVPMAEEYPMLDVVNALLPGLVVDSEIARKTFFTSTAAFAIALGLYKGYKKIDMYGVELEVAAEYQYQRDSTCFWIGVASATPGVTFTLHSQMLDVPIYGLESFISIDKKHFINNISTYAPLVDAERVKYETARDKAHSLFVRFEQQDSVRKELEEAILEQSKSAQAFGRLDGAKQENERYLARAHTMEQASGHYVFSRHEFERDKNAIRLQREKTILQWSEIAGRCQQILQQIGLPYDSKRRKLYHELGNLVDNYIKLSVMIGMYTGGAEEDDRLRKLMDLK